MLFVEVNWYEVVFELREGSGESGLVLVPSEALEDETRVLETGEENYSESKSRVVEEARVREEEGLVADGEVDFDWRDDECVQEQHFLLRTD